MRRVAQVVVACVLLAILPAARPAKQTAQQLPSAEQVILWIKGYRLNPEPAKLPVVVKVLSQLGAFREPDSAGLYVGFIAGVLGTNPDKADKLIGEFFPLKEQDTWVVARAIAYSGLPNWPDLMRSAQARMPRRQVMVDSYLNRKLPILQDLRIDKEQSTWAWMAKAVTFQSDPKPKVVMKPSPVVMDNLWGYYYATGALAPLQNIIAMLPMSKDTDDAERLTIGSTAKYSLASNASQDPEMLDALKEARPGASEEARPILDEVIFAAETVEVGKLRTDAQAAIAELKSKGPAYKRQITWWGTMGEGAISLGCVVAAVVGTVALGIPCVVGGAATSAALRYFSTPE
jgi:hypothetical protein